MKALCKSLTVNISLRELDISYNTLTDSSLSLLCDLLRGGSFLRSLNLDSIYYPYVNFIS